MHSNNSEHSLSKDQDQRLFLGKGKKKVKIHRRAGIQCCEQI